MWVFSVHKDEWIFQISVQKIDDEKDYCEPFVQKSVGKLKQYPEYNE